MPSIFPGFEYDIFISYRHNDNARGWVTGFATHLTEELAATIKEPLSIYFDINPIDGLLETHQVDKSLEGKLKCVIFIPIISQTYCDPRCFAWRSEFLSFNRLAKADSLGRDILLASRNVASRILPVKIHDLDAEDKALLENELEGPIRCVEFIYKSSGVNRPLSPTDHPDKNALKTDYRDQVNKVANAVKEIIYAIKYPGKVLTIPEPAQPSQKPVQSIPAIGNSIAVLPFVNLSQDQSQEYFADGVMENILIQLAGLRQLRVISRTTAMRYRKTTKSAPEIADELNVKYILEGSAQLHGAKVRIQVQLIDAQQDHQVWGKVFLENLDDIFSIQQGVADIVVKELHTTLQPEENKKLREIPTRNLRAYDLFLKGRHAFNQWNLEGYRTAEKYFIQAIAEDTDFTQAYSYLASTYSALMSWNGDLSPSESMEKINQYLPVATRHGATDNDMMTHAVVKFFVEKDFESAEQWLKKAMEAGPNNADVRYMYSYLQSMMGKPEDALQTADMAKALDPDSASSYNYTGIACYLLHRYDAARSTFRDGLQRFPQSLRLYDHLARTLITTRDFEEAVQMIDFALQSTTIRPPSMAAYKAIALIGANRWDEAKPLLEELIERSKKEKGVNLYVAHIFVAFGDLTAAREWLGKARSTNDIDLIWFKVDPWLAPLRDAGTGSPDFEGTEKFIRNKLREELPSKLRYHNTEHVEDVLRSALNIALREKLPAEEIPILRIAALFHDSGLVVAHKGHEEKGCELVREVLPSFDFSKDQIEVICSMIMATRIPQTPNNLLERILCDADLDYLGREDFYDMGEKLHEELRDSGTIETIREWNLIQKTFLENHRYHTAYSQQVREPAKQQRLKEITEKLRK